MKSEYDPAEKAKKYSKIKTRLFFSSLIVTVVALAAFQVFLSRPVAEMAFSLQSNFYGACFIFAGVFLLYMYAAGFPLHFAGSFVVEHYFSLSRQSFGGWLADEIKSTVLSFGLSVICIQAFYLLLRNFPFLWWVFSAAAWLFFSVVLAKILPVVIIPIFFKYLPLEDNTLRGEIIALAEKAGIQLTDVCRIDFSRKTSKANAAVAGLGKTRKVILADTLTDNFTPYEITAVVAHEFGHIKYRHLWQILAFSAVATISGFFILFLVSAKIVALTGASGLSDLYLFPVLMFLLFVSGIILLPVQNLFSRILEHQADRFALELTGRPVEFISMMRKLAEMNMADADPSKMKKVFMYDHPPVNERISMARRYEERD